VRPFCEEQPAAQRGEGGGAAGSCRLQQRHSHFPRTIYVPPPPFYLVIVKLTSGMADWRDWAQTCPSGSSPDLVARLPAVACKRGAAALGLQTTGTPLGVCVRCCARRKRAASRDLSPSLSATTLPPRSPTAGVPTSGVPLAPRLMPHLGRAPSPPVPL